MIRDQMEKDEKWYTKSTTLTHLPGSVCPLNVVRKGTSATFRGTTNASAPHNKWDSGGRPLAVNAGVDMEDEGEHPCSKWFHLALFHQGVSVVWAAYNCIVEAHPEFAEVGKPAGSMDDNKSYFRFFKGCVRDRGLQSVAIAQPGGPMEVYDTDSSGFGIQPWPNNAHHYGMVESQAVRKEYWRWEEWLCVQARDASSRFHADAKRLCPLAYLDLVEKRRQVLGDEHKFPMVSEKYIDDRGNVALGVVREIKLTNIMWRITWGSAHGLAQGKFRHGHQLPYLGVNHALTLGWRQLGQEKTAQSLEWLERAIGQSTMEGKEMEALAGTLNFAAIAIRDGRVCMVRTNRHLHEPRAFFTGKRGLKRTRITDGLKKDWALLHSRVKTRQFLPMLEENIHRVIRTGERDSGATDANHTLSAYCGASGFAFVNGELFYWMIEFPAHLVAAVPVHILEFVAELVQLRVIPGLGNRRYHEYNDNMAVVSVIRKGNSKDPRNQDMLILRGRVADERGGPWWCIDTDYVRSKENDSDSLSRGKEHVFLARMQEIGVKKAQRVEVEIEDLNALFTKLIAITDTMSDAPHYTAMRTPCHE